jgi:Transposase DDE domain
MNDFESELMRRSPLAAAVLEMNDHVFDQAMLDSIYERHRGRCYTGTLTFDAALKLMRDALTRHHGSGHALFLQLEKRDANPVDESNFYRKLAKMPAQVSRALLREGAVKLSALMPGPVVGMPACFDKFDLIVGDGKKIKNAAKRLAPTRGYTGKLIGAKALVAVDIRTGLAVAMSDSLDGMTNDVPLVPALMDQLREVIARPILSVWDRQFDDLKTMGHLSARPGDAYAVRMKQTHTFVVESGVITTDSQGRTVTDEIGLMGKGKAATTVRRITLSRPGDEDVVLLTNLFDRRAFPADDLLALYKHRWGIEQVFQQVTETFDLQHLIGCSPRAVLLQFAYCLLLYNQIQVVKAYVARDGKVSTTTVSTYYLFDKVRRELTAWAYHTDGQWPRTPRDASAMRARLRELLEGSWDPITLKKAADKKPRVKPPPKYRLHGGHNSVQRVLNGTAKKVAL